MLKKTLIAAAITSLVSVPALASTVVAVKGSDTTKDFVTNTVASQTKEDVLAKSSLDGKVTIYVDNTPSPDTKDEVKVGSEFEFKLTGGAKFNTSGIEDLMSVSGDPTDESLISWPALSIDITNSTGTVTNTLSSVADFKNLFVIDEVAGTGGDTVYTIRHQLSSDGVTLSLKVKDDLSGTVATGVGADTVAFSDATFGVGINWNESFLENVFNLPANPTSSNIVKMSIGSIIGGSYAANPKYTPTLFNFEDLFTLKQDTSGLGTEGQDATASVADTYTQLDKTSPVSVRTVTLYNNSSLQSIQTGELRLTLSGDFSGLSLSDSSLWTKNTDNSYTTLYSNLTADKTIPGEVDLASYPLNLPDFVVASDNETSIEAGSFTLKANIIDSSFTYNYYEYSLANVFVITRDGMKFDTVTTGTTSSNVIYIRDVSKTLPEEGGKIFVTITEYDAHDTDANGNGTDLITRAVLPTRLPSNGAVTLTPAGVAEALGVEINPSRQARFFFEVETNQGEAAVKKATSGGVDIQTGRSQNVTDFTL